MTSWRDVRQSFGALFRVLLDKNGDPSEAWDRFAMLAANEPIPAHLICIFEELKDRRDCFILDHGCGTGLNVCFLFVKGFNNVRGIDLGGRGEILTALNEYLVETGKADEPLYAIYDGKQTAFPDETFDLIYSHQVIEHLSESDFEVYFTEEARIAKPNGVIVHEFPHRWMLYDGHLRTYFVHMLPDRQLRAVLSMAGRPSANVVGNGVYLRSFREITRRLLIRFVDIEDLTLSRLRRPLDVKDYEGTIFLRRVFAVLVALPGVGNLAARISIRTIRARKPASENIGWGSLTPPLEARKSAPTS